MKLDDLQVLARAGHGAEVYGLLGIQAQNMPAPPRKPFAGTYTHTHGHVHTHGHSSDDLFDQDLPGQWFSRSAESIVTHEREIRSRKSRARLTWDDTRPHNSPCVTTRADGSQWCNGDLVTPERAAQILGTVR